MTIIPDEDANKPWPTHCRVCKRQFSAGWSCRCGRFVIGQCADCHVCPPVLPPPVERSEAVRREYDLPYWWVTHA